MNPNRMRVRWAAIGAAVAVTLGAGGIGIVTATTSSGERPIFVPIEPCRLADLRPAPNTVGPRTAPLGPEETYTLSGWGTVGDCSLPSGTTGLSLNVTALNATQQTFLTLFPAAADRPTASNLNPSPGQPPAPNAVNVDLDVGGEFSIYNEDGFVNVIVDVIGYYDDHDHDDRYYREDEVQSLLGGGRLVIGAASFVQNDTENGTTYVYDSGRRVGGSGINGGNCLVAPVDVPNGATVTGMTVNATVFNNLPNMFLRRVPAGFDLAETMAEMSAVGLPAGEQSVEVTDIDHALVDRTAYSYVVDSCAYSSVNVSLHDVVIDYTLP